MDQNLTSIENEIKNERRDLDRNLEELEGQARALADWRTHFRRHPVAALGLAAGAGLALAALIPSGHHVRRPRQTYMSRAADSSRPLAASTWARVDPHGQASQRLSETWDRVIDSLAGVGAAAVIGLVSKYVPGFHETYHERSRAGRVGR